MAATITHTQIRSSTGTPPIYSVQDTVTAATGIATECFVFKTIGGDFDHVATPLDMQTYLNNQVDAANANHAFFRQPAVTKTFTTVTLAQDFADTLRSRLTSLANEYDLVVVTFLGTTTETLP